MARVSRAIVLAEDDRHQRFVRRYLDRLGYQERDLYFEPLPFGRGCGEQWVRTNYARAVGAYRARSARAQTALIVAIDANGGNVERRLEQLRSALSQNGLPPRGDAEKIVHLIPKRSIETWILCLNGRAVDEETDYSNDREVDQLVRSAAEALFDWSRPNAVLPFHRVPSLSASIPEMRRLG